MSKREFGGITGDLGRMVCRDPRTGCSWGSSSACLYSSDMWHLEDLRVHRSDREDRKDMILIIGEHIRENTDMQ